MTTLADLTDDDIDVLNTNLAACRIMMGVAREHLDLAKSDLGLAQKVASNRIADALQAMVNAEVDTMAEVIGLELDDARDTLKQVIEYLMDGNRRQGATR